VEVYDTTELDSGLVRFSQPECQLFEDVSILESSVYVDQSWI
jgi:hypothetical protein